MSEQSSYNGEMAVGQVWRENHGGRLFKIEGRRLVKGAKAKAQVRISETGGDYGRWVDTLWLVNNAKRVDITG